MLGGILVSIFSDRPRLSKTAFQFVDFQNELNSGGEGSHVWSRYHVLNFLSPECLESHDPIISLRACLLNSINPYLKPQEPNQYTWTPPTPPPTNPLTNNPPP